VYGEYTTAGSQQRTRELFSVDPAHRPSALYVTNYYMTFGTLIALDELGLTIPADVSLVGFDHPEMFDVVHPSLTVVEQPLPRMGQAAGEMLLQRLRGDYADYPRKQEISTRMLVRSSVRRLTPEA
jgi:DNA-binding LacI/PurR family transcriptional regulator